MQVYKNILCVLVMGAAIVPTVAKAGGAANADLGPATGKAGASAKLSVTTCFLDCNHNGVDDQCDVGCQHAGAVCANGGAAIRLAPCDGGFFLSCGTSSDCNGDLKPDECQLFNNDCNNNLRPDDCDIAAGSSADCNGNGVPDECDIASGTSIDCPTDPVRGANGIPDECELAAGNDADADTIPDSCDNCFLPNIEQLDDDDDGVGYPCDNCEPMKPQNHCDIVDCANPDQLDMDSDGVGDVCDNCLSCPNGDQANTDSDFTGDACDNCLGFGSTNQFDCDGDNLGDVCELANFFGDNDNDGVQNLFDVCDFTPNPLPPGATLLPNGTLLGDLDGDCDVDADDAAILNANLTGPGCASGLQVSQTCDAPPADNPPFSAEPTVCGSAPPVNQ